MDNLSKILIVPLGGNDYNSPTPRFLNPCGDSSMLHQSLDDIEKFNFDMILIILFNNPHLEQQINRINYLNEKNHDFKIVSIEPTNSFLLLTHSFLILFVLIFMSFTTS